MQKRIFCYFESITVTVHLIFSTFFFISRFKNCYRNLQINWTQFSSLLVLFACSTSIIFVIKKVSTNNLRWKEWKNSLLRFLLVILVHKPNLTRDFVRNIALWNFSGLSWSLRFWEFSNERHYLIFLFEIYMSTNWSEVLHRLKNNQQNVNEKSNNDNKLFIKSNNEFSFFSSSRHTSELEQ